MYQNQKLKQKIFNRFDEVSYELCDLTSRELYFASTYVELTLHIYTFSLSDVDYFSLVDVKNHIHATTFKIYSCRTHFDVVFVIPKIAYEK